MLHLLDSDSASVCVRVCECVCVESLLSNAMCNSDAEDKHNQNGLHFDSASVITSNNNNNSNHNNNNNNKNNNNSSSYDSKDNSNDSQKTIVNMKQMKRYSAFEVPRKKTTPQLLKSLSLNIGGNNSRSIYEEERQQQHHHGASEGFACFCCEREEPLQTLCNDERVKTW